MQMGFGLQQEQSQRLIMTTQMKQAIELLQCSAIELQEYINDYALGNPVAEVLPADRLLSLPWTHKPGGSLAQRTAPPLEQVVAGETSAWEELTAQLGMMPLPREVFTVARYLAGSLDESGFLPCAIEDIARETNTSLAVAKQALEAVQSCDPKGVAARDLRECLRLQLPMVDPGLRPLAADIVESHLEDLAAGRMTAIAKKLKRTPREVQRAADAVRRLNPRPGLALSAVPPMYVVPDVIVEDVEGQYIVTANDAAEPRLRVSERTIRLLESAADEETRAYLSRQLQSVHWLAKCLEQRRLTLYRVADVIISVQAEFLRNGPSAMRPLTLRQVAEAIGVHESTVSRATRGKFMLTPRGLYEMKFFFTAELHAAGGATSAQAAKWQIRHLIEQEDPSQPLSDDAIARSLFDEGIHISRRTVAKYREELNIAPSSRRKRYLG